ncbi:pyridoxal phosphate-dependent aminotransferase [Aestuariivirga litoralis]|uniref:Pyridoxal phosphate-dependent aminotransferase n=1 Tax=Aestuariivirga litoralis TaxID=2650924 RepID=A0A2W2AJL6_9HYPH|nr:pyridoxal phosphate-dependent aminotransferase [Aestuariivirga litoralis]PZF75655.1 pyridoxal phosphate-dependent aminotransferase [Aestuariivirga litoralis]
MPFPFTPLVDKLPSSVPFVGPEALERRTGTKFRARIGANESVFGPSPTVIAAIAAAAAESWQYCDPENHDIKAALAKHLGVAPENVMVGEGIDGLFGYAVRLFVEPGVTVATSLGAYPTFNFHVQGFGGRLVTTPYVDDREDPDSLIDLATRETARLIYFANPDNPMGSWWDHGSVQRMIDRIPDGALLMLDEAYGEFAPEGTLPPLDVTNPSLLRFRTFSKAYGLAGLRLGYCIGHADLIRAFDKIRNHFGVTKLGQVAGIAALGDQPHLNSVVGKVITARDRIAAIARSNGLTPLPSATNFVAIDCGRDGDHARRVLDALVAAGIFVRMPGVAPLNRCIRVTAGTGEDLALFAEELPKALAKAD